MPAACQRFALAVRSDLPIEAQVQAGGATWLDRQLVARKPACLNSGGFGHEVREAMNIRVVDQCEAAGRQVQPLPIDAHDRLAFLCRMIRQAGARSDSRRRRLKFAPPQRVEEITCEYDALALPVGEALPNQVLGWAFVFQCSTGLILEQWPSQDGHYPLLAYQVAFGLNVALQIAALVWLELPRLRALSPAFASALGRSFFAHRTALEPVTRYGC